MAFWLQDAAHVEWRLTGLAQRAMNVMIKDYERM